MPSDTHHKRSDLTFAARDNQNPRRSLCERIVRGNLGDKGMHLRTAPIGQTSPRDPQGPYHLLRQTEREVVVRNRSKIHNDNDTDEIHVVVMRVDRRTRVTTFQLRVHSRDHRPPGRTFRTRTSTLWASLSVLDTR
jgi:hypothetical protein